MTNINNESGRLLFVDNEPNIISSLKRQLRNKGHQLCFCETPEEGIEKLKEVNGEFDIVFADVRMSTMTGVEFFEIVEKSWPDIMRIVLTGYTELNTVLQSINKGKIYQYITKPWEEPDLNLAIKHALHKRYLEVEKKILINEITEQNASLSSLNDELSFTVKNLEKAKEDLQQAKHAAETYALDQINFHKELNKELNTILDGSYNMISLLNETNLDGEQIEYIETIKSSNDSAISTINNMLDLSTIEVGEFTEEKIKFNLKNSIEHVVDKYFAIAANKNIEVVFNYHDNTPHWVLGDPMRIKQIFEYLYYDILMFSKNSTIDIDISIDESCQSSVSIIFRLFASFEEPVSIQLEDKSSANTSHNIAMELCNKLVDMLKGTTDSEFFDENNYEAWFKLDFPLVDELVFDICDDANLKGFSAALLTDSKITENVINNLLKNSECQAIRSFNSKQLDGNNFIASNFDVVIVESNLLKMNYLEFIKELKNENENLKIMVLEGRGLRGDASKARQVGVNAYLTKPVDEKILTDCFKILKYGKVNDKFPLLTKYLIKDIQKRQLMECANKES